MRAASRRAAISACAVGSLAAIGALPPRPTSRRLHDDRADRHLAARGRGARERERLAHPVGVVSARRSSTWKWWKTRWTIGAATTPPPPQQHEAGEQRVDRFDDLPQVRSLAKLGRGAHPGRQQRGMAEGVVPVRALERPMEEDRSGCDPQSHETGRGGHEDHHPADEHLARQKALVPPLEQVQLHRRPAPITASASISTRISGAIRRDTSTIEHAGRIAANASPCARPTASHWPMSTT